MSSYAPFGNQNTGYTGYGWGGPRRAQNNQGTQMPSGGPPPPPTMAYGQQQSFSGGSVNPQQQAAPAPPPQGQDAASAWQQQYQRFSQNSDYKDPTYGNPQWAAWAQEEQQRQANGTGAKGCPDNLPFTGRMGQCAAKPDDCPDGMQVVGSDTDGSAHCVPSGMGGGGGGFGGGGGGRPMPPQPRARLLADTFAPQLGYFGQQGAMPGAGAGGMSPQVLQQLLTALLGMQVG